MPSNRPVSGSGQRQGPREDTGQYAAVNGRSDRSDSGYGAAAYHGYTLGADGQYRRRRLGRVLPASGADGFRGWLRMALANYGWRVYAVPVLAVITVLVIVNAVAPGGGRGEAADAHSPVATERPATPVDPKVATAELPHGGPVTEQGKGHWHVVPGKGPVIGSDGKRYRYTVEVEDGIDPAQYGGDKAFSKLVDQILGNPKSWTGDGQVRMQRVQKRPDFRISLTTPKTDHKSKYCGYTIKYESSCYRESTDRVVINLARWVRGAQAFSGDMFTYREYAINHEVGHALGNHHVGCKHDGGLAPVMMQQTFGVSNDYVAKVNKVDPTNRTAVPANHLTCAPNAWPNPQAKDDKHGARDTGRKGS